MEGEEGFGEGLDEVGVVGPEGEGGPVGKGVGDEAGFV